MKEKASKIISTVITICILSSLAVLADKGKEPVIDYFLPIEASVKVEDPVEINNSADGTGSLVRNGDFELIREDGKAEGWNEVFGNNTNIVRVSTEDSYSGKNSIRITNNNSNQPWARQRITNGISENAVYQTTAWVKTSSPGESIKFKWEFRGDDERQGGDYYIAGFHSEQLNINPGVWTKVVSNVRLPKGTVAIDLYVRLFGVGDVYWDDVEFYMIEEPPKIYPDSDTYYYTDWGTGKASITINDYYPVDPASTVDFILKDGENVLYEKINSPLTDDNKAFFEFSVMQLAEIGKAYHIEMIYKDGAGNVIAQEKEEVYRYNRPTRLNEDGLVIIDGEVFTPVIGYHVPIELLPRLKEAGINTVQSNHYRNSQGRRANSADIETLIEYLDEAHKHGIMVLPVLYPDMFAAGHPSNVEKTQAAVAAVKDHPAVLGYMVLDEPYNHVGVIPPGSTYEDIDEWLKASYKVIRDVDSHNLVYTCCTGYRQEEALKHLDAFTRDPYPPGNRQMSIFVSNSISEAVEAANYRKPVWVINAAVAVLGGFEPDSNSVRHMAYQSLFAGAKALGWYQVQAEVQVGAPKEEIWNREGIWEGIECFAQVEQEDAIKHFITGEYPLFSGNQNKDSRYWYRIFAKENELYAIILSRSTGEVAVEIPLTSYDGSISVGAFKTVVDDISEQPDISGNGTLSFTLEPEQVVRFKITPNERMDFSSLKSGVFRDLVNYPWARDQIEAIAEKGIVNSKGTQNFVPQENITRADFAYFLIRTLGLTSDSTETFGDVINDAHYAKEIATGKALGILKGVGDDRYNPNAAISRQDMMTICARGMEYVGKLGTEGKNESALNFTDTNMISDYAIDSIAAMVSQEIVLGNADGTINPIGNTTRAEAAVIMYRILSK